MIRSPRILPITRRFNLVDENHQPKVHVLSAGLMLCAASLVTATRQNIRRQDSSGIDARPQGSGHGWWPSGSLHLSLSFSLSQEEGSRHANRGRTERCRRWRGSRWRPKVERTNRDRLPDNQAARTADPVKTSAWRVGGKLHGDRNGQPEK